MNCKKMNLNKIITHGSLFSGIGGPDFAAKKLGWRNVFQVEKDEWCRKVLEKNFPNTKRYTDIKEFKADKYNGTIDVISGGFPCQPFSNAGKRRGKDDDRYLWPEMFRIIKEIKPTYAVCENVTGIINLELDKVLSDLEIEGYTTETFIIPACAKNAWHRRDRVWIIAYDESRINSKYIIEKDQRQIQEFGESISNGNVFSYENDFKESSVFSNTIGLRLQQGSNKQKYTQEKHFGKTDPIFNGKNWEAEPGVDRVVHGVPNWVDRIRGLGNAIVPQVAFEIFKNIEYISKI